ncbi:HTH-type transcriptional regulator YofA [compost metagenome]
MEIRLMKTFQSIVKLGSFRLAAEALQYSQPTITVQIKKLEDELGVKLFERGGKTIELTDAGRFFYERSDVLLKNYSELNEMMSNYLNGETGSIRIGAAEPSASMRIPEIVASFLKTQPQVKIKVSVGTNRELMQMLLDHEIDFAFCHQPENNLLETCRQPAGEVELEFEPLQSEKLVLLLPEDHILNIGRDEIYLHDLEHQRFILTPVTCPFRIRMESLLAQKIESLSTNSVEVGSLTAIKYYVQAGIGISLVPVVEAVPLLKGTVVKSVIDLGQGPEMGILINRQARGLSIMAERLIESIRTHWR